MVRPAFIRVSLLLVVGMLLNSPVITAQSQSPHTSVTRGSHDSQGDDHGDTQDTATQAKVNTDILGTLNFAGDVDYFQFALTENSTVTITTVSDIDTVCQIESASETLATNDDGGEGKNCLIEIDQSFGNYWVRVRGFATEEGPYTLVITADSEDISDIQDMPDELSINAELPTRLGHVDDIDFYRIDIEEAGYLHIHTLGDTDTVGCLLDERPESEKSIWNCDDDSGENLNFSHTLPIRDATHFVLRVTGREGAIGNYSLFAEFLSTSIIGDGFLNAGSISATTRNWSYQIQTAVNSSGLDYHLLDITYPSELVAYAKGPLDTQASLFQATDLQNPLFTATEGGEDMNFKFSLTVAPGTYYVVVEGSSDDNLSEYQFHVEISHPTE